MDLTIVGLIVTIVGTYVFTAFFFYVLGCITTVQRLRRYEKWTAAKHHEFISAAANWWERPPEEAPK